jgi:5,5'-dehydrodivanillate O-demethylase
MLRRRLFEDIDAVQAGRDPKGVLRDPERNQRVVLPSDSRDFFLHGLPLADYQRHPKWARLLNHFIFHAGQPAWVQQAHAEATGVAIQPMQVLDL